MSSWPSHSLRFVKDIDVQRSSSMLDLHQTPDRHEKHGDRDAPTATMAQA